jgi:hypothetical protein
MITTDKKKQSKKQSGGGLVWFKIKSKSISVEKKPHINIKTMDKM